eukprot:4347604-Pyramimonas_sp.AAC.1
MVGSNCWMVLRRPFMVFQYLGMPGPAQRPRILRRAPRGDFQARPFGDTPSSQRRCISNCSCTSRRRNPPARPR